MPTDNVFVHNNSGARLDDLSNSVAVQRSSKLAYGVEASRGNTSIDVIDPKATQRNLKASNILYIKSSDTSIREYAALLWNSDPTGNEVADGRMNLPLRSYEWILDTRVTAKQENLYGTPGEIFIALIYAARRTGYLPISTDTGSVNVGGQPVSKEYRYAPIYQTINKLAEEFGFYWWLQPSIDTTVTPPVLSMIPNWVPKRSRNFKPRLSSGGDNPNFSIRSTREIGEPANHIIAYGKGETWKTTPTYEEKDFESIGFYKQAFQFVLPCLDISTEKALIPIVQKELEKRAFPLLQVDGAFNYGPYPLVGDICQVELPPNSPFINSRRQSIVGMQVEYHTLTPQDSSFIVHLKELRVVAQK